MFLKIFRVSANEEMGKQSKLVEFSTQNLFQIPFPSPEPFVPFGLRLSLF